MEPDEVSVEVQQALDLEHIRFWDRAVALQGGRALKGYLNIDDADEDDPTAAVEAYLFAFTLRQLIRAVEFCRHYNEIGVQQALDRFHEAIPGSVQVRDIISHFDDYERGVGRLQVNGAVPRSIQHSFMYTRSTTVINVPPLRLDVARAMRAAGQLWIEATEAVLPGSIRL